MELDEVLVGSPRATGTVRLTLGRALVRFLGNQWSERDGVRRPLVPGIFGIFGHGNASGVGYGLATGEGGVRYFQGKNEQAMVHAAFGFAKAHDRLSTLGVTTSIGPGATNLVTGAATATVNRIPVLLLPGDVFARRRQGPVLQQLEHDVSFDVSVNDALRPVSRYFDRITRPEQIIESLPQAMRALLEPGRTGAVTIALCQDAQGEPYDYPLSLFEPRVHVVARQPVATESVRAGADVIASAERPFLIAGGGVRYSAAGDAVRRFSSELGVPVGETHAGRGATAGCALTAGGLGFVGSPAANALAERAEVVIAVGTRLSDTITGSHSLFQHPDVRFVCVNVDSADAAKLGGVPLVGDASLAVDSLTDALRERDWSAPSEYVAEARETISRGSEVIAAELDRVDHGINAARVVAELNQFTRPEDRVIISSSLAIGPLHCMWDGTRGARCDLEYGFSCMGHEIPGAVGARLADVDAGEVYALLGDGTYLMGNTSELVTARQEGVKIIAVVTVNDGFQSIARFQQNAMGFEFGTQFRRADEDGYGGDVVDVDYVANAAAFGCATFAADDVAGFRAALAAARAERAPCLIAVRTNDVPFDVPAGAWWDYGAPNVPEDERVAERLAAHASAADRQRWYT